MDDVKKGTSAPSVNVNAKNIYRGFSTADSFGRSFKLTDKELVNRDLLNHIYTIPGERIGRPDFGTVIPMLAFEQADPKTISIIERELKTVVDADPRVELISMAVMATPDNNAILAIMDLKYIELDSFVDSLSITVGGS